MTADPCAGDERVARLHEFEMRHRLFEPLCDGWSMWRVLRRAVHREVTVEDHIAVAAPAPVTSRYRNAPAQAARLFQRMIAPGRADLVLMTATSALRDEAGDRYRDLYFDELLDSGLSAFKIEARNSARFNSRSAQAERPAQVDLLAIDFLARLRARLRPLPGVAQAFSETLSAALREELGVDLPPQWLRGALATVREQAWIHERILRRVRPKAVLVVDTAEFAMLIACRRTGIPLIEVQHGVFTWEHPEAIPALPDLDPATLLLPDRLAAFGNYWKRELAGTAFPPEHIVPVGNILIDRMRPLRARHRRGETIRLLVTAQGLATEELVAWLSAFAAAAPADARWRMHVKLHPIYERTAEPYAALAAYPQVEIVPGDQDPSTTALLAEADLHLSISSTCHFDALSIGVPTVILPLHGYRVISFIADDRSAFIARDPADIWRIVASDPTVPDQGHDYCAPGYVANLRALVDSL